MNDKDTGSFYTPKKLVKYMTEYAVSRCKDGLILEPSVGDGRFIDKIKKYDCHIDAIELDENKIKKLQKKKTDKIDLIHQNFIEYALNSTRKYDLIIGNPPYITKKKLSESDRLLSIELIKHWSLPESIFQNLWVSFVLGAVKLLKNKTGSIFFVLPFEFLQVHYAEKLRRFLEESFNTIEITTFQESVFTDIEQDVCLVYLTNYEGQEPIVKYTTVKSIDSFKPIDYSEIKRNKPLSKWSNSILNDDETELLKKLSSRYTQVSSLGDISPGIVTGANNFFILNRTTVEKLGCQEYVIPIIQKSSAIGSMLEFKEADYDALLNSNKNALMLNLNGVEREVFSNELNEYILGGETAEIHKRYKCSQRKRWFDVPVISSGDLMFFKRYNKLPRLMVNEPRVFTTDISYNIRLSNSFDAKSVAFCFYNSLTITLCEYNGRFYGGGVGELVPSEFKSLCIPYKQIEAENIEILDEMIRRSYPVEQIIQYVDTIVLDDLELYELEKIMKIREKYLSRRLKEDF